MPRFESGSINLHPVHDIVVLQSVLRTQYVSRRQLLRFARIAGNEELPSSFNRRLRRLVEHGYIELFQSEPPYRGVYRIAPRGEEVLVLRGEVYSKETQSKDSQQTRAEMKHWLELNELQLLMTECLMIDRWIPETEIRATNEYSNIRYAKDYDGVLDLSIPYEGLKVAVELEQWGKSRKRYEEMCRAISAEIRVAAVLYLAPSWQLVELLRAALSMSKLPIFVALLGDFQDRVFGCDSWEAGKIDATQSLYTRFTGLHERVKEKKTALLNRAKQITGAAITIR